MEQIGAYVKGNRTGIEKWYYPNGQLVERGNVCERKRNGMMREFDDDGTLLTEGNYVDGKQEGDWKYSIGEYVAEGKFVEGKEDGFGSNITETANLFLKESTSKDLETGNTHITGRMVACTRSAITDLAYRMVNGFYTMREEQKCWNWHTAVVMKEDRQHGCTGRELNQPYF